MPEQHSAEATIVGQAVGTPAYMSPEQAKGKLDEVGPASDIYSLGATLYNLLTGQPPFPSYDASLVIDMVITRQFPPPHQMARYVPPALEAIVLKAMAEHPHERYPTAQALAADVERWMADEPVSAYDEPFPERLNRWGRRHRTLVSSALVLLLTTLVALGIGLVFVSRARDQAKQNLVLAEKNLELSKQAVDECFLVATEDPRLQSEKMQEVRRLLLTKALPFYKDFRSQRPNDQGILEETGQSLFRVAFITAEVGSVQEAIELYKSAVEVFEKLVQQHPIEATYRIDLARVCNNLGTRQAEVGLRAEARASYQKARELREALALRGRHEARADLAETLANLGSLAAQDGNPDLARKLYAQASDIQREIATRYEVVRYRVQLAATLTNLGNERLAQKDHESAEKAYREALEVGEQLLRVDNDSFRRRAVADTLVGLGVLYSETNRLDEAVRAFERARDIFGVLANEFKDVADYRSGQATAMFNLGDVLTERGKLVTAVPLLCQAERVRRALVTDHPGVVRHRVELAYAVLRLSEITADRAGFDEVLSLAAKVNEMEPGHPGWRDLARRARVGLAKSYDHERKYRDAVAQWNEALATAKGPVALSARVHRATSLVKAGEAESAIKEVLALQQETLSGEQFYNLACVAALSGREKDAPKAVELLERARRAGLFADPEMVAHVGVDSDLDSLRRREDFKAFLDRVRKKGGF